MNTMLRTAVTSLALLALASLAPSALPAQTSPTSTLPLAEVRFMSWEQAQSGLFTTTDGRDFKPVNAPAYAFGRPSQVRGDLPLRLYERVMRDGRPVYEIVAEAAIEPGFRRAQAYLVRQPDHDGRRSYRLIAMSNDPDAFRVGEVRVFNFSPYHCMVRIGDTPVGMAPLEWRTLSATPDRKHRVALAATLQVADAWTPVARGMITLRENFRGDATLLHTRASLDPGAPEAAVNETRVMLVTSSEYIHPATNRREEQAASLSALVR